ncbi:MAG TPA: DUF5715 family protein, partial [Blastocatellia bacterium]|nr:DUF5715 family protein [Blastocatellia bacterium]
MGLALQRSSPALWLLALLYLCVSLTLSCRTSQPIPPAAVHAAPDPLASAIARVEEARGEATGDLAPLEVPAELKHYSDRRRFLAVQIAESRKLRSEIPSDFADLIRMIWARQVVEMDKLGEDYVLYGVGEMATTDLFTHFDAATKSDVPLYPTFDEFKQERDRLRSSRTEIRTQIADLGRQFKRTSKRDRASRRLLASQLGETRKSAGELDARLELLERFYLNATRRAHLEAEYRLIAELARNFEGESYDLSNGEERRRLKMRLLSFIRPEARDAIEQIASSYKGRFGRPLPVTSLIRTVNYQRLLRETNRNATSVSIPPHTTGLAFDLYNHYMPAEEQSFLMEEIAAM